MAPGLAIYHAVEAMVPLYVAALLGYASVRWFRAFSDEQCAGINHFVALYAVPLLVFHMVATNDPYAMNGRFVGADTLQKALVLLVLAAWALLSSRRRRRRGGSSSGGSPLRWVVTNFSVATLPNTIIMGVPLLTGMYGEVSRGLIVQVVVMQACVWYNLVVFLYEYMAAMDAGSAKICPGSPVPPAAAESGRVHDVDDDDDDASSAGRSDRHEVTVAIEITEMAAAENNNAAAAKDDVTAAGVVPAAAPAQKAPSVMRVVWMAGKRLAKVPITYASLLGLIWSLMAFKVGIKFPKIVDDSLTTINRTAVGLSMFASGTFIARQQRFVPCGYTIASLSMVLKFLVGPVVMLLTSLALRLRGNILHIAVVQAALPLAVNSFVYAAEYKVHAEIMSTGVILGTFISLPVTIVYYILLGL